MDPSSLTKSSPWDPNRISVLPDRRRVDSSFGLICCLCAATPPSVLWIRGGTFPIDVQQPPHPHLHSDPLLNLPHDHATETSAQNVTGCSSLLFFFFPCLFSTKSPPIPPHKIYTHSIAHIAAPLYTTRPDDVSANSTSICWMFHMKASSFCM